MNTAPITATTASNEVLASKNKLSADMNTFLTLLTTQLKYQDPMEPMDATEFTNQLVAYSEVEQAIATNEKLDTLISLNNANLGAQTINYLGLTAQVVGNVFPLEDGKAKVAYTFDKAVDSAVITIKDSNGDIIYSTEAEKTQGTHEFEWDGTDSDGNKLEDGAYQFEVTTKVAEGEKNAEVTSTIFGKVTGVASDDKGVYVGLGDAVTANVNDILTIRPDDYFDKVAENDNTDNGTETDNTQSDNNSDSEQV